MTDKLTWAEFVEKYKPNDSEKFKDDRGHEWVFSRNGDFNCGEAFVSCSSGHSGSILTCPLIPRKAKRKLWPALCKNSLEQNYISRQVFENERDAKNGVGSDFFSWPAIPGPDGSYTVEE